MLRLHFALALVCGFQVAYANELTTVDRPFRPAVVAVPVSPPDQAAAKAAPAPVERWEVKVTDVTLAKTFERWAVRAGYRLKWDAQKNFLVGAPDSIEGTFEDAVAKVLASPGIREGDFPLEACVYANSPPLMRITRSGAQARECASDK